MQKKEQQRKEAIRLRGEGLSLSQIALQLGVAKSSVSTWVRGVELTQEQVDQLEERRRNKVVGKSAGGKVNRERFLKLRQEYQAAGREKAKEMCMLHAIGCMLYWAEGAKGKNSIYFVNSDPNMILLFARFLREELEVKDEEMVITIHCHNEEDVPRIEQYWVNLLGLTPAALRKTQIKKGSTTRHNRLENGVCGIRVGRTDLMMHIYGAIQEYGGFDNPDWLF